MDAEATTETAELDSLYYRSLVADLRAAVWCERFLNEPDDHALLARFGAIHQFFVRNIDRDRPELFRGLDRAFLVDVVRRWMVLYLRALEDLRQRYPYTDESADLVAEGCNWSERLGISYEGLDRLDITSRYAEIWAERSVTWATTRARGEGVLETYEARLEFIGSPFDHWYDHLKRTGQLQLLDAAGNGITSFDFHAMLVGLERIEDLGAELRRREWHVAALPRDVFDDLLAAARSGDVQWRMAS